MFVRMKLGKGEEDGIPLMFLKTPYLHLLRNNIIECPVPFTGCLRNSVLIGVNGVVLFRNGPQCMAVPFPSRSLISTEF